MVAGRHGNQVDNAQLLMDSKNKTQSLLCAVERDGTGTWLIPSPVLMAASVIHIPMLCSSPGKAGQHGKHGKKECG